MKALKLCLGNRHVDQSFHVFVSKVISSAIAQDRSATTSKARQHKTLSKLLPKYLDLRRLHIKYTQCIHDAFGACEAAAACCCCGLCFSKYAARYSTGSLGRSLTT